MYRYSCIRMEYYLSTAKRRSWPAFEGILKRRSERDRGVRKIAEYCTVSRTCRALNRATIRGEKRDKLRSLLPSSSSSSSIFLSRRCVLSYAGTNIRFASLAAGSMHAYASTKRFGALVYVCARALPVRARIVRHTPGED